MRAPGRLWIMGLLAVWLCALAGGCGADPNGPGSYQAVMNAHANAEEVLRKQGGKLEQKQYPQGSAWAVDLSNCEISEETWTSLKNIGHVSELNLSGTKVNDIDLLAINEFGTVLFNLNLSKTSISDAGLRELVAGFLKQLDLRDTKVTAQGVEEFLKKRSENALIRADFKKVDIKR
jgi:hypothetical protein